MLEKGIDQSECQALEKSRKQDPSGAYTVSSFDVMQIAKDMGISEDEANELLGLKKSGEMEPIYDRDGDGKPLKGEKLEKDSDKKKKMMKDGKKMEKKCK